MEVEVQLFGVDKEEIRAEGEIEGLIGEVELGQGSDLITACEFALGVVGGELVDALLTGEAEVDRG